MGWRGWEKKKGRGPGGKKEAWLKKQKKKIFGWEKKKKKRIPDGRVKKTKGRWGRKKNRRREKDAVTSPNGRKRGKGRKIRVRRNKGGGP